MGCCGRRVKVEQQQEEADNMKVMERSSGSLNYHIIIIINTSQQAVFASTILMNERYESRLCVYYSLLFCDCFQLARNSIVQFEDIIVYDTRG